MYDDGKIISNGFKPVSQFPIDDRLVKADLVELANLGTDDYKAYTYYEGMEVFVLSTSSTYKWVEDNTGLGITGGFTYPNNVINCGIDYSNRTFDFVSALVNYENITHADLVTLITNSNLQIGKDYNITDFATKHIIPNSGGVINTGSTEILTVKALDVNKLDIVAKSKTYPQDIIYYEITDSSTAGGDKGRITYRKDTEQNISTGYDWRNVKFRRFVNAQTLTFSAGASINQLGQKVIGGTSGALGYILGGTGANILRVVNISGVFQIGETVTNVNGGTVRTTTNVADYSVDTDTYVSNGRASSDVYTFVDNIATGVYNINIAPLSGGPSDKLNNITFSSGSHDVSLKGDSYDCSMSVCTFLNAESPFYSNYFRASPSYNDFRGDTYSNFIYGIFSGNTSLGSFIGNTIAGAFEGNKLLGYYFDLNTIEYDFKYNTSQVRFTTNIVNTNSVRYNNIEADVQGQTFLYTATEITQFWTKRLIKGSDGIYYLEYYNGTALVYVDPCK